MNVFGSETLDIYQNPSDNLNSKQTDRLTEIAQAAFDKEGVPTEKDVKEHILPVSTLVTAKKDDELIGFSSTETYGDTVYAVGNAVDPDHMQNGVGKAMRSLGVLEEMDGEAEIVATRTQNPRVLSYMQNIFNGYPREYEETPERIEKSLEELAEILDADAKYRTEDQVMESAYPESMYDEIPEHDLKKFTDKVLDYEQGDALLIGGKVSKQEVEQKYRKLQEQTGFEARYVDK